jgi:cytoskeletal protein CcmA (bactofilin family)
MIWNRDEGRAEAPASPISEQEVRAMPGEGEVTVVGQGAKLEGTLVSAGSLRIDGQVKGQVNADGDVLLSPQSQVEADIHADSVTVAGRFKGNIFVNGKAELARGGRIDGNVTSKVLVIQEGGIFCGQSLMDQQERAAAPPAPPAAPSAQVQRAETATSGDRSAEKARAT